jgi:hypothetical protein
MVVTVLGRGCESADVSNNLAGLLIGMAVGALLAVIWRFARSP